MSLEPRGDIAHLNGQCRAEDAEALLSFLQADPARRVDLTAAGALHTAVLQVLLALRPGVIGPPTDAFTKMWIAPILTRNL
jgi:hypothetical protein